MSSIGTTAPAARAPLIGRRVLVIEDEYFIADDITRELASLGAEVIGPLGEIEEAQRVLSACTVIDAALLDINIRSSMIFPLARELKARNVPFVFTTGYEKASLSPEFQDVPVFEKPLDLPAMSRSLVGMILQGGAA
ncbi:response regulator [Bradyrhizobium sp. ARR65]|uniref:response regulator n=1 Tax=Bradyrhizobium sp. ARR65 TaxID=1040989 RepID=UPI0004645605|nr:response regulator [Bradyrhizobium sp. ARR65]